MKIEQLIIASNPSAVILSDNMTMKDKLDHLEEEVINILKTKKDLCVLISRILPKLDQKKRSKRPVDNISNIW